MFGFIKQIIIQYCDLIVQANKCVIKDAKSALIKLSSIPEGCSHYFQKVTHLFLLIVCFAEETSPFFTFNISDIAKSVKILPLIPSSQFFILKSQHLSFKKKFSSWTDVKYRTNMWFHYICFII